MKGQCMKRESSKAAMVLAFLMLAGGSAHAGAPAETSTSPSVPQRVRHVAVRAFDATRRGLEHGAEATAHGVKRGIRAAGQGIETGANAVGRVAHRVVDRL